MLTHNAGHEVLTPELLGNGRDATPPADINLQTYVETIGALESAEESAQTTFIALNRRTSK